MKITYWASDSSSFLPDRTLNLAFPFGGMLSSPPFSNYSETKKDF
jgi:hypothetical protein